MDIKLLVQSQGHRAIIDHSHKYKCSPSILARILDEFEGQCYPNGRYQVVSSEYGKIVSVIVL